MECICQKCNKRFSTSIKLENGEWYRGGAKRKNCYECYPKRIHGMCNNDFKECAECGQVRCKDQFYKTRSKCKTCYNVYIRKRAVTFQREQKAKAIKYLGGKCIKCGYNKHMAALHFHHIDPSTKNHDVSINKRMNKKFEKWDLTEINKCIILCANCHAIEHAQY